VSPADPEAPVYEVRCDDCDVSFPPQTRRCLHCGRPLRGRGSRRARAPSPTLPGPEPVEGADGAPEPIDLEPEDEYEARPRSGLRMGMNAVWLLIALGATCYRMCAGG